MVVLAGADWQGVEYYDANKGFSAIQNAFVNPFASAGIMDFWEKRSASQSRMSANYSEAVRGVSTYTTPSGTRVPIWYDPKKPERVIIAEDLSMAEPVKSWKRTRKRSLIWMIISVGIMMFVLAREEELPELSLTATTIGQFSQEISALADKTPTALVYTESIGSPETFSAMVDDPAIAKEALDIILSAAVDKRGFYMDMYQLQYEEYRFVFDEETYTFGFVPKSYFCYGGKYYELGENRLAKVRNTLHGDQP